LEKREYLAVSGTPNRRAANVIDFNR